MGRAIPLTFLAQIDLSMAAAAYPGPWPLPSRGRLSFFWDPLCGCYGQGVANTRVIWDDTDASRLVPLDHPISDYPSHVAGLPPVMPGTVRRPDAGMVLPQSRHDALARL